MIKLYLNGEFITNVESVEDCTWVKNRRDIIKNNEQIQQRLKDMGKKIGAISFHPDERYLKVYTEGDFPNE